MQSGEREALLPPDHEAPASWGGASLPLVSKATATAADGGTPRSAVPRLPLVRICGGWVGDSYPTPKPCRACRRAMPPCLPCLPNLEEAPNGFHRSGEKGDLLQPDPNELPRESPTYPLLQHITWTTRRLRSPLTLACRWDSAGLVGTAGGYAARSYFILGRSHCHS